MRRLACSPKHSLVPALAMVCLVSPVGCVSTDTHTKALTELETAKKTAAKQAIELDTLTKQSQAQTAQLKQQLVSLQQNLDQETAHRKTFEQQAAELTKEREALAARSSDLQARLDGLEKDKSQLNGELADARGQIIELEQKLASGNASAQDEITKLQKHASDLEMEAARIAEEREQLRQEQSQLTTSLEQERQRLKAEEAGKARLEQERAAKEAEIQRLTRAQEELSKSLQDEITKGNITIQQVRDHLTINMVDRVLFDSGQAQVKPAGVKVLKQVGDVLKSVEDKQVRIEGHTDNVPISSKLQDKFKTNWELSTARATNVVRYLIDQGSVSRSRLSAVGYADTHPLASNETEQGRASNRRIEIVLYPRELGNIGAQSSESPKPAGGQ